MAEFIVTLNESMPESERFILYRLDDTHMYVLPHAAAMEWMYST
jgi:TFIIH basal transcription factor complex TTD-A subunit